MTPGTIRAIAESGREAAYADALSFIQGMAADYARREDWAGARAAREIAAALSRYSSATPVSVTDAAQNGRK